MRALTTVERSAAHGEAIEKNQRITLLEEDEKGRTEDSTPEADMSSTISGGSDDPIQSENEEKDVDSDSHVGDYDNQDPRAKVLSVVELEDLFVASAPDLSGEVSASGQTHNCSYIA